MQLEYNFTFDVVETMYKNKANICHDKLYISDC